MKASRGFTLIEYLIGLAIVLSLLSLVFASELRFYERQFFAELGVSEGGQVLLAIPLAAGALYLRYRRGRLQEHVSTWLVASGLGVIVFGVAAVAWLLTA